MIDIQPPTMMKGSTSTRSTAKASLRLLLLVISINLQSSQSFTSSALTRRSRECCSRSTVLREESSDANNAEEPVVYELDDLRQYTVRAATPRAPDTTDGAHDAFRFEWGRWVNDDAMENLQDITDSIRLVGGAYDELIQSRRQEGNDAINGDTIDDDEKVPPPGRYRLEGDKHWDIILHVLPPGREWSGRWPTGSWAIVRALTGVAEISMLRGPNRDGIYTKATNKLLRGGGDGTLGGGGTATGGEDSVKYVGGALRSYGGKSGKTTLLEVVVRPPISVEEVDGDGRDTTNIQILDDPRRFLMIALPIVAEAKVDEEEEEDEEEPNHLGAKMGMTFDRVGGLDDQLNAIVRRVLASRANPEAARRLGVNHVRGILLSGPPGCGKTLLARELSHMLGARAPQIVNGPEILDKFVGEAEKNIRALFAPAEREFAQVGDASALHVIILDEMDAIARKRGTITGDSTGVRDSVVNQLLAKMDGVKEANNVLVVGLTNRPELLDPALLRPGRLEVQLRVELPDLSGRRDILRIHTRRMKGAGGLSAEAQSVLESLDSDGISARTDHFTGAELAGLVRSAASFALARTVEEENADGVITVKDLNRALLEVRPALGKQDEVLEQRYPYGISNFSPDMGSAMKSLQRFTSAQIKTPGNKSTIRSLLLTSEAAGCGVTALACWAAAQASNSGKADYVRFITLLDLMKDGGGTDEQSRAAALVDRFTEAQEMPTSLLVLDDIDHICAGTGPNGMSTTMVATLHALLRSPPGTTTNAKAGGHITAKSKKAGDNNNTGSGKTIQVIATTSRREIADPIFETSFDEYVTAPEMCDADWVSTLLKDSCAYSGLVIDDPDEMAKHILNQLDGFAGCKRVLKEAEAIIAQKQYNMELENVSLPSLIKK